MARRAKASAYEVRCPKCDVSFPVGTRTCVHCGGRTGKPVGFVSAENFDPEAQRLAAAARTTDQRSLRYSSAPIEPAPESPFSIGESGLGEPVENDRDLEIPDEPTSIGRMIARSLGGIIWVILLIGFSIARDCGN